MILGILIIIVGLSLLSLLTWKAFEVDNGILFCMMLIGALVFGGIGLYGGVLLIINSLEERMNYKNIGENIKNHIKEKTGYDYDVMIITIDGDNLTTRLLVHSEDEKKEAWKESEIDLFTELINAATQYSWWRKVEEKNWLLLANSDGNT